MTLEQYLIFVVFYAFLLIVALWFVRSIWGIAFNLRQRNEEKFRENQDRDRSDP